MTSIYRIIIVGFIFIQILGCSNDEDKNTIASTFKDIDGNVYHTIQIGTQTWMVENLKVTRFLNGDIILDLTDSSDWCNSTINGYCFYDSAKYGLLYNYYTISDDRKLAPEGWRVPNDNDWQTLIDFLGGNVVAGGKLKEEGILDWKSPNSGANNSSGFKALPGGLRKPDGQYKFIGEHGYFWSITEWVDNQYTAIELSYDDFSAIQPDVYSNYKSTGYSIRCIKE